MLGAGTILKKAVDEKPRVFQGSHAASILHGFIANDSSAWVEHALNFGKNGSDLHVMEGPSDKYQIEGVVREGQRMRVHGPDGFEWQSKILQPSPRRYAAF